MPIKVEFPGGDIREVPSVRRELKSRQIGGGPSTFFDEPAFDTKWTFESAIGGKWWANPRR